MADCCQGLEEELAALKAEVAKLKPVDEQRIIQASIAGAEQLIIPAVMALVAQRLIPLLQQIDAIASLARATLNIAQSAASTAASAAAKVAGLALTVANILLTLGTINVLGGRIDAVENGIAAFNDDYSRLINAIAAVRGIAQNARDTAITAIGKADAAGSTANRAISKADNAESTAKDAVNRANKATETANNAITQANNAQNLAIQAGQQAREAAIRANAAINTANQASDKADQAIGEAQSALQRANESYQQSKAAISKAELAIGTANKAISTANEAIEDAKNAINKAENAINKAVTAENKADKANSKVDNLTNRVEYIDAQVLGFSYSIPALAGGFNALGSQQQELDRKFNQLVADNRRALGLGGMSFNRSALSQEFDKKLEEFERLSTLNADARFNEFVAQNNQALGIRDLKQSALSQEFDRKLEDFKRLSTADANTRFNEFVAQNQRDLSGTNNRVEVLAQAVPQINNRVNSVAGAIPGIQAQQRENERLNKEGLNKLDQLISAVPSVPAATAALITPAIPTLPRIREAAASGVCQTTRSGGCLSNALGLQTGNILNGVRNNLGSVLDGVNTGANAAQLILLQRIDGKLGAQVPGGLSRLTTQITQNQAINQIANLVTMAAAIHNCIQLSDNVSQTFFSILDNIFAIPSLIVNPEGETVDTQEVFNGAIENVMKSVFGVAEWAEIKAKWQSYNRIYQAATNSLNEIRSIGSSLNDAISTTATLTGRGFNALQNEGLIGEDNWNPTPETLRLKGGIFGKMGKLADGITVVGETLEAIESITSEIRSAVESANQIKQNTSEMEAEVKKLLGEETKKRDEEIEALPAKSFSWEDLI
ncbi:hypothetical protein [Anabaena azotica]|uniref:Uncharacterized protein n=1 Tax=Anabaena azotica FACHB-119 TaxID=947527 RepID=A0ABR8D7K5_9NOST|nr:hypothetical protein [Anabaena azotica]MBD2503130.1 hypothetical protein [Anabaena azotica FACHB-119]